MPCPIPCHAIPYHTIPYHTIPYHTIQDAMPDAIPYHTRCHARCVLYLLQRPTIVLFGTDCTSGAQQQARHSSANNRTHRVTRRETNTTRNKHDEKTHIDEGWWQATKSATPTTPKSNTRISNTEIYTQHIHVHDHRSRRCVYFCHRSRRCIQRLERNCLYRGTANKNLSPNTTTILYAVSVVGSRFTWRRAHLVQCLLLICVLFYMTSLFFTRTRWKTKGQQTKEQDGSVVYLPCHL